MRSNDNSEIPRLSSLLLADTATPVTDKPQAHEDEVKFILDAISEYLTVKVRRSDVLSTWAGLRPLASDPNAADTESASRDHIVTRDPDGLLTVTGMALFYSCKLSQQTSLMRVAKSWSSGI